MLQGLEELQNLPREDGLDSRGSNLVAVVQGGVPLQFISSLLPKGIASGGRGLDCQGCLLDLHFGGITCWDVVV